MIQRFKQWKAKLGEQASFVIAAAALAIVTVGLSIYLLTFLVSNLTDVLGVTSHTASTKQFDTEGFEKLNLGR